ncbi:MAG: transposase [Acidipropionibacterium sp.]|nr:transposase [Acidipropionibacterium sp.]
MSEKRQAVQDAAGVLPSATGILVHDAWSPYDTFEDADHQLCAAHLIRELAAVIDHHSAHDPPDTFCWGRQVMDGLLVLIWDCWPPSAA